MHLRAGAYQSAVLMGIAFAGVAWANFLGPGHLDFFRRGDLEFREKEFAVKERGREGLFFFSRADLGGCTEIRRRGGAVDRADRSVSQCPKVWVGMEITPVCRVPLGSAASSITFLRNGLLAVGDASGRVAFIDPATAHFRHSLVRSEPIFYDADEGDFVSSGRPLAAPVVTADGGTAVLVYTLGALVVDLPGGTVRHRLSRDDEYQHDEDGLVGLPWTAVLDDSGRVAILYAHPVDGISAILWDLTSGDRIGTFHGEQWECLVQSAAASEWLVADVNGNLVRWEIETQKSLKTILAASMSVRQRLLSLSRPGVELALKDVITDMVPDLARTRLLTLRKNGAIVVVETATGSELREEYTDAGTWVAPNAGHLLAFSPDGESFLSPGKPRRLPGSTWPPVTSIGPGQPTRPLPDVPSFPHTV